MTMSALPRAATRSSCTRGRIATLAAHLMPLRNSGVSHIATGILLPVLRRLVWSVVTWLGVIVLTFVVARIVPADPAALLAGPEATPAQVAALRAKLGLDQSMPLQLWHYLVNLAHGNLGKSLFTARPVTDDLSGRLPATIELAGAALLVSIAVGVPVGVLAATRRNSLFDHVVRVLTVSGFAIASFWLAIMLQLLFAMDLGLLPLTGRIQGPVPATITGLYLVDSLLTLRFGEFAQAAAHIALPMATLAFPVLATIVRFTRAGVLDALDRPSVQYADAMGLPRAVIVWKYVLRSAVTSVITQIGLLTGALLGGSVVVEAIFDWPGLGYYLVNSIVMFDYNAVLGATIWIAAAYIVASMAVDFAHTWVDPRAHSR